MSPLREGSVSGSIRGSFTFNWRTDTRKLFAVFAAVAIAGCQSDVIEAVPEAPDPAVRELLALLGSRYDETSDARLRYALGLPDDFPIGRTIVASVTDGPGGSEVAADIGPRCSLRDGDSEEEAIAFTHCHAAAAADPNCTVQTR